LQDLKTLHMRWNRLIRLPSELGNRAKLQHVELEGNPLIFPPPEIVNQGTHAKAHHPQRPRQPTNRNTRPMTHERPTQRH
jgi:Leucine-rich repeat (LRR) protein